MQVTNKMLARYVGGQMEIQNLDEGYLFRGEIQTIVVEEGELKVKFAWVAKGEGNLPLPGRWVKNDRLDYAINLEFYAVSNIGSSGGEIGGGDRINFSSDIVGETAILFPPDGSKLDPTKIEGLF